MNHRIQSSRLYEQLANQIRQQIMDGALKQGDWLPTEREMSEQYGVSRTVVREAVKALAQQGLVEVQHGRGTLISYETTRAVKKSLDLMMSLGGLGEWSDLLEIREILEPRLAALAAVRARETDIAKMREAVEKMDDAIGDAEIFSDADLDFHMALAEATGNVLVQLLIDVLVDQLRQQRILMFAVDGGPERGQHHHKRILETIMCGDMEAAYEAMRAHLEQVRTDVEAAITLGKDHFM